MARKKNWSRMVEAHGVKIRLYERTGSSSVWREIRLPDGTKDRKSMKHGDRELAIQEAEELARILAESRLTGRDLRALTLGQVFSAYFHPTTGKSFNREAWRKAAETRRDLFLEVWGRDLEVLDIAQGHVDRYSSARRKGKVSPLGNGGRGDRPPVKVRDGTLDADFRWLSSVFNWARGHKLNGRRLLPENPLHDVEWPKEQNVRRPVASHDRYTRTLETVDEVDPEGRLRCILELARWTGRRESAICGLLVSDLLLTPERTREALAAEGMDESMADHMPHGAIRWPAGTDKQGLLHITPVSRQTREALDRYLRLSPRLGDAPLFPAPKDPGNPIRRDTASSWLVKAERAAGLPKLRGGTFHPYRRLWATERKSLPDADVAAAGGWKDTRALKMSYQHADPATVRRVVEGAG